MIRFIFLMTLMLMISLAGFGKNVHADVTAKDVTHDTARATHSAATYAEQERDKYVHEAQKEIDELTVGIDRLGVKAREARVDAKAKLDADIKALDKKWDATESKLGDVKAVNVQAWKKLKSGMDSAIEDLKHSFARARKEFI